MFHVREKNKMKMNVMPSKIGGGYTRILLKSLFCLEPS